MPNLSSSNLSSYTYNPATGALSITFSRGDTYTYLGVPPDVVAGLELAGSAGIYFNENIRDAYPTQRRDRRGRYMSRAVRVAKVVRSL